MSSSDVTVRLFLDTETTGLPLWSEFVGGKKVAVAADDPRQPRMCQLAMVLLEQNGGGEVRELDSFDGIIRPDGWIVPDDVARLHGLTTEICMARGVPVRDALDRYKAFFDRCDELLAFGTQFDTKILRGELRRADMADRFGEKPEACVMKAATPICRMPATGPMIKAGRGNTFKTPKLSEAHQILLGSALQNAHDAMADVRGCIAVWQHLQTNGHMPRAVKRESLPEGMRPACTRKAAEPVAAAPASTEMF